MSASLIGEDECELELRDMVAETLENNGVLPKIRAQLRASVFLALDETAGGDQARRFQSAPLRQLAALTSGRRCLALVREMLACLQLDCTLSVLDAELQGVAGWREERSRLAAALGVSPADGQPVIAALIAEREGAASGGADGMTSPPESARSAVSEEAEASTRSAASGHSAGSADSGDAKNGQNGCEAGSDEEDSFFDSLPKVRSSGLSTTPVEAPVKQLDPIRRNNGELPAPHGEILGGLPPLGARGTLPPLRGSLPALKTAHPPFGNTQQQLDEEESISEDIGGDSLASDSLQSDGITEDVSLTASEVKADFMENM